MSTEDTIRDIAKIVNGRTVAVIAYGQSLKLLDENIEDFEGFDLCWCSVNSVQGANLILERIGSQVDIVTSYASELKKKWMNSYQVKMAEPKGGSMQTFLHQLCLAGIKRIAIFGFNGYSVKGTPHHRLAFKNHRGITERHKEDTKLFNENFQCPEGILIINCSPETKITAIRSVDYECCLDTLALWEQTDSSKEFQAF